VTPKPFRYRRRLPDAERMLWRSFVLAHARIIRRLDEELRADHDLDLAGFEVLFELVTSPGNRLRMTDLADHLVYTRSGITRLVNRLAERGYLERSAVADDARGVYARLTQKGFDAFLAAVDDHLATLRCLFFEPLGKDTEAFGRIVGGLADNAG
jgi:DNA-binding MarR family transcriptional regulator